jgi:hypothetical protein
MIQELENPVILETLNCVLIQCYFVLSTVHDLLFFSQHMIQELENPVVLETLNFLPIPCFLVANCV